MNPFKLRAVPPLKSPREEAADWLLLEEQGRLGAEDGVRLEAWLAEPANAEAYAAVADIYRLADEHAAAPGVMDLRRSALADRRQPRPVVLSVATAAGLMLAVGLGWSSLSTMPVGNAPSPVARVSEMIGARTNPDAAVYRTRVGERLTFTLPDGSVATLNTNSVLKVAYADAERGVRLVQGQALFEVAKDKKKPFRVYAGDRRITALGTVFDVRLDGDKVKVALVEGVVRVTPTKPAATAAPAQQVDLAPGEVLEAARAAPMLVTTLDARRAVSWKSGIVEFSGETLADAVGEMNRYSHQPIAIADASIAGYRVSGVFRTGEPELFARMMSEVLPITVEEGPGGALTLKHGPG